MTPLCATILLLTTPAIAAAQSAGGNSEILHQWDGGASGIYMGWSVSDAGDVNGDGFADQIVGAPHASPGGLAAAGSAFVYSGADGSLLYQWHGGIDDANFGFSVSSAGDTNADGFADLIIGIPASLPFGSPRYGSASVFSGADGSLLHHWQGPGLRDSFGQSVAGVGDLNGDGFDDLIIGAPAASPGGLSHAGSAFIYSGADGSLLSQRNGGAPDANFGNSVASAGDVNADGLADVIIGAFTAGPGSTREVGSAFVYSGANGARLYRWDGSAFGGFFGYSVSGAGDLNADGFDDVIVGAHATDSGAGSAYVYSGADGSLLFQWNGQSEGAFLGRSVAGAGDMNADGYDDVLVGVQFDFIENKGKVGSANLYSGATGDLLHKWAEGSNGSVSGFGFAVSSAGDVNGDGIPEVIISAPWADNSNASSAGSAYVFDFQPFLHASTYTISAASGGVLDLTLNFPDAAAFNDYKILISETGVGPTHFGVDIPLTQDSLTVDSFYGIYPMATYADLHGTLDSFGDATGSLTVPAGLPSSMIGNIYYFAAIANPPGLLPEYSSIALSLRITP